MTAYTKAHFPHEFFTSYLKHAVGKPDTFGEVEELVNNAKIMGIAVMPPSIIHMHPDFTLIGQTPTYGITNVKGVGVSVFKKMHDDMKANGIDPADCDWDCFLIRVSPFVNKRAFESLILGGAFDCFGLSRSRMHHNFSTIKELTKREVEWLVNYKTQNPQTTTKEGLEEMVQASLTTSRSRPIFRQARVPVIEDLIDAYENPGYSLNDSPSWTAKQEREYLGTALTCHKVDEYDISHSNCSCKEFIDGFKDRYGAILAVRVDSIREWTIKKGRAKGLPMDSLQLVTLAVHLIM